MLHLLIYSNYRNDRVVVDSNNISLCASILNKIWRDTDVDGHMGSSCIRIKNGGRTKIAIEWIVDTYGNDYPSLNRLVTPIKKLKPDEGFYIIDEDKDTTNNIVYRKVAILCLEAEKHGNSWKGVHNRAFEYYSHLNNFFKYYSFGFDGLKYSAGEPDKSKRKCRFCGKTGAKNFHDVAHAIQDSLGNDLLICNEECDECNHNLNKIEDNFLHVMEVRRSVFHISRKKSAKSAHVTGYNFVIEPNEDGEAELYLMDEKLPPVDKRNKPFQYTLFNKPEITNEGVFQALVKMVIDLLPNTEIKHFEQTIDWITSLGNMYPGPLPSMYLANSPLFHRQPTLDILIRKVDKGDTPYCTAFLWIYDLVYAYVVPLVDVDYARFRTDGSLERHWNFLMSLYPFQWTKQDTSEWTKASSWVQIYVDISNPKIHILPKNTPIFNDSNKLKKIGEEMFFPSFDSSHISVPVVTTSFYDIHKNINDTIVDLREVTEHPKEFSLSLNKTKKEIRFVLDIHTNDSTDKIPYFDYKINATFQVGCFDKYIRIEKKEDGGTFAFDWHLRDHLVKSAILFAELQMAAKRKGTPFENFTIHHLLKTESLDRMLDHLVYRFSFNGRSYRVIDIAIHSRDYINPA